MDNVFHSVILFLLERPKTYPLWSHILHIVDNQRKVISLKNEVNSSQISGNGNINAMKKHKVMVVEDTNDGGQELGTTEHEIIHRSVNIQYHDFDDPRVGKSFEFGQTWTFHSEGDGLRYTYARIDIFITSEGMVEVILLESHPMIEEDMHWIEENLPMSCGTFKPSKSTCIKEITLFSHRVICNEVKTLKFFISEKERSGLFTSIGILIGFVTI